MTEQDTNILCTQAWLLKGIFNTPGVLELAGGRLAFTGEDGRVFEGALGDVTNINFPWYYFGGGVKLQVGTTKYRISFTRPNGAASASGRLLASVGGAAGLLTAGLIVRDIGSGLKAGKAWRTALAA